MIVIIVQIAIKYYLFFYPKQISWGKYDGEPPCLG